MKGPWASNTKEIINTVSEIPTTIVKARLKYNFTGDVDFNFKLETVWTKTNVDPNETVTQNLEGDITGQYGSIAEWVIPWDARFKGGYSNSTKLTVTAVVEGESFTKELLNTYKILGDEDLFNYHIYTSPREQTTLFGRWPLDLKAEAYKGAGVTGLPREYIPDDIKFNLVVTEGQEHGVISYKPNHETVTDTGTALYDLEQYRSWGRVYFDYIPHKEVLSEERVTITVSTTDANIKPVDLEITLAPNPFLAYADPSTIKPGDTTSIFLKFINNAGDTVDFAEDQEIYLELWDGWWHGDLYSDVEDYTSYYMWYTPPPFSFIANNDTDEDDDNDTVLVYAEVYVNFDDDGNPLPASREINNKITTKRNILPRNEFALLRKQYKEERMQSNGNGAGTLVYEKRSDTVKQLDDNTAHPSMSETNQKIGGKPNKLSQDDVALLRKQLRDERKEELLQNRNNSEGSVVYEEDNIKITQLAYGSTSDETLVYTYFEIVISKNDDVEIMLGETKYFGVMEKTTSDGTTHKLAEIPTEYGDEPKWSNVTLTDGWLWIKERHLWGNEPIEVLSKEDSAKSCVYWESQWFDKSANINQPLSLGMIRLIGRYWEEGKEEDFKVKFNPAYYHVELETQIKVIKPNKLLSEGESRSYAKTKDVFDKIVNIDSLCIYWGGKSGIPPYMLKGHIAQESAKKDFGGTVGWGFAPSYLYEPYTVQNWKTIIKDKKNNPFYITATTKVDPPDHQHVKLIPYYSGNPITVWQIVKEHSQLVEDGSTPETRMYGTRTHEDTMNYSPYRSIKRTYRGFLDKYEGVTVVGENGKKRDMTLSERAAAANQRMIIYLRDEFLFKDGTKGMKNMIAQTRIASSYGFFQALYTTALGWGYDEDSEHLPEDLNEPEVLFSYTVKAYNKYISYEVEIENNNWYNGFEETIKSTVYPGWNTDKEYPDKTLNNVKRFLPQK